VRADARLHSDPLRPHWESDKIRLSSLRGYYARTAAWLGSVTKLNDPGDVQAISVAARSLFESAVDLVLVHHGRESFDKMYAWERSAQLDYLENVMQFFGGAPTGAYVDTRAKLSTGQPAEIDAERRRFYGKPTHPARWTGQHIEKDVVEADKLLADAGRRPASFSFREFYELEYAMLCWATHGSTLLGLRATSTDFVPAQSAMRMNRIHDFALCITQVVLEELKLFDQKDFDQFLARAQQEVAAIKL